MLPTAVKILFGVGAIGMFIGWSLFIRMAIELNRVLPLQKKFFILELRIHFHEVKRLHEEFFPVSALRATWFAFMVSSVIIMTAAIIIAVKPK
jgi:hypothetical protein